MKRKEDKVAIIFGSEKITYSKLYEEVKKRRELLEKRNITNSIVGLMFSRKPEYLYWILTLLDAGICFLPLDVKMPESRLNYILNNSELELIVSDGDEIIDSKINLENNSNTHNKSKGKLKRGTLAYVMYTSGTTGEPKGVMISKRALEHFLGNFLNDKISEEHIFLANTSFTFDISIVELVLPIMKGATLYLTSEIEQKNPKLIAKLIEKYRFDWVQFTPSYLLMILNYKDAIMCLSNVKNIIVGGEKVPKPLAVLLKEKTNSFLYNAYGPTETTIWTHVGNLRDDFVNVGSALHGVTEFILNEEMKEVDKGVLWLGGETISDGYINDIVLTEKKFKMRNGEMLYNSGDIAYKKNGKTVIVGRNDNQIKIAGKRVELEEIESLIIENLELYQCVVLELMGELILVVDNKNLELDRLIRIMKNKIDTIFIPKKIVYMESFPLLISGKIDRRKVKDKYMEQMDFENKITNILKEFIVGEIDRNISINDLGVSSLEYVMLIVKIEKVFGIEFEDFALVMSGFDTLGKFIEYVEKLVNE